MCSARDEKWMKWSFFLFSLSQDWSLSAGWKSAALLCASRIFPLAVCWLGRSSTFVNSGAWSHPIAEQLLTLTSPHGAPSRPFSSWTDYWTAHLCHKVNTSLSHVDMYCLLGFWFFWRTPSCCGQGFNIYPLSLLLALQKWWVSYRAAIRLCWTAWMPRCRYAGCRS